MSEQAKHRDVSAARIIDLGDIKIAVLDAPDAQHGVALEIENTTPVDIDLFGRTISSEADDFLVVDSIIVPAGDRISIGHANIESEAERAEVIVESADLLGFINQTFIKKKKKEPDLDGIDVFEAEDIELQEDSFDFN